jgi:FkbM family methyltransferase
MLESSELLTRLRSRARHYHEAVSRTASRFPETPMVNLFEHKPTVELTWEPGAVLDRYAASFVDRLRFLDVPLALAPCETAGLRVDLSDRLSRSSPPPADSVEIQHAVVWLGIEHFAHLRDRAIRKTVENFARLMAAAEMMEDELSVATMLAAITDQLTGVPLELPRLAMSYETQYFGTGLFPLSQSERILDAGAANGDSLDKFLRYGGNFAAYYAFEPDPHLFCELEQRAAGCDRLIASSQPLALESGRRWLTIDPRSGNTRLSGEGETVEVISIDEALNGRPVSMIKMDVEGAEPDLLLGAKNTIRRYRPKLMISAYHQADHLFEIPELIRAMVPDYKLYVRNHSWANVTDSWPGSFFCETVVYAV